MWKPVCAVEAANASISRAARLIRRPRNSVRGPYDEGDQPPIPRKGETTLLWFTRGSRPTDRGQPLQ
jgi:hypothetical protein